jgi:hypothetical protein
MTRGWSGSIHRSVCQLFSNCACSQTPQTHFEVEWVELGKEKEGDKKDSRKVVCEVLGAFPLERSEVVWGKLLDDTLALLTKPTGLAEPSPFKVLQCCCFRCENNAPRSTTDLDFKVLARLHA